MSTCPFIKDGVCENEDCSRIPTVFIRTISDLLIKIEGIEVTYKDEQLSMANEAIHTMQTYAREASFLLGKLNPPCFKYL